MKRIKILLLLVCAFGFSTTRAQVLPQEFAYEYVATYTWNGSVSDSWEDPANWDTAFVSNGLLVADPDFGVRTIPPTIPGVEDVGGITHIHNVVIPTNSFNRYPNLANANFVNNTITVSDLTIAAGATLELGGKALIIQGFISGTGQIIGGRGAFAGQNSDISIQRLNTGNFYHNSTAMDAKFSGATYSNNFNLGARPLAPANAAPVFGEINTGNNAAPVFAFHQEGTIYRMSAQAIIANVAATTGGTLYLFQRPASTATLPPSLGGGTINIPAQTALSTTTELDEMELTFAGGSQVYAFSAFFSITDFDFTPMYLGKLIDDDLSATTPAIPTRTNDGNVAITLEGGDVYNYTFDASGQYLGFTFSKPIQSILVSTGVFFTNVQNAGYPTIDDVKLGTRVATGALTLGQTIVPDVSNQREIGTLTVNIADAASVNLTDQVELAAPVEILRAVNPQSGIIKTYPGVSTTTSNLILNSSEGLATASVSPHTSAGNILGKTTVKRYIDNNIPGAVGGGNRKKQWRFLGLPYRNPTLLSELSGINFSVTTPTMMQFFEFSNGVGTAGTYGNTGPRSNGYQTYTALTNSIESLNGFVAWIYDGATATGTLSSSQTLVSSGELFEDGLPVTKGPLSYLDVLTRVNPAQDLGWNLVSNPFAAPIAINDAVNVSFNRLNPVIYRWNPQAENWTTYNRTTNAGTGGANNIVESGASFFVQAIAANPTATPAITGNAQIVFNQNAKRPDASNFGFFQFKKNNTQLGLAQSVVGGSNESEQLPTGIRIKASGPGNPIPGDALLALSIQDATASFDNQYDAFAFGRSSGAAVAIRGNDKSYFAIQADKPIAEAGKEKRIYPLAFTAPSLGAAKLELELEGTWNSLNKVYLVDKKEGKTIPMTGNKLTYNFTLTSLNEEGRFELAFNTLSAFEKSGSTTVDVRVMNNPVQNDVVDALIAHPTAKPKSFSIVNGTGATLNKGAIPDDNSLQHRLNFGKSNANGVFYLKVDFENGDSKTVKFIKL